MAKKLIIYFLFLLLTSMVCSCSNNTSEDDNGDTAEVKTPATAVVVNRQSLQDGIWLNATVRYLKKSVVKSSVNGYITSTSLLPGQSVSRGQILFTLKTKEAAIIGNQLPDSLRFNGNIIVRASQNGFISQLDHQQGDYVQDGEQLCTIADRNSYGMILQVPFELTDHIKTGSLVKVMLPDGKQITGKVITRMPTVDSVSQTQQYLITPVPFVSLPENLIVKIWIAKSVQNGVQVLPKSAVLTDEAQSHYWVMKMINDTTAVKIPVQVGIEDSSSVQIIAPQFSDQDKILNTGNYGLPDTAFVTLTKTVSNE